MQIIYELVTFFNSMIIFLLSSSELLILNELSKMDK